MDQKRNLFRNSGLFSAELMVKTKKKVFARNSGLFRAKLMAKTKTEKIKEDESGVEDHKKRFSQEMRIISEVYCCISIIKKRLWAG